MSNRDSKTEENQHEVPAQKTENDTTVSVENDTKTKQSAQPVVKPIVHKKDWEKDVIYVYQFHRTPVIPSVSPFCLKLETWLRLTGLKYENVDHKVKFKSHKGQLPFVELNGCEIADSSLIIKELNQIFDVDLDKNLSPEQQIASHTAIAMIENHLYWILYYFRSRDPNQFLSNTKMNLKRMLGSKLPSSLVNFLFKWRMKQGLERVKAQGLGVHSPEEILEFGKADLGILCKLLNGKAYFFDVVAFSVLAQMICTDENNPFVLMEWMKENTPNLIDFVNRMKEHCYPDWEQMCSTLELNTHLPKKEEPCTVEENPHKKEDGVIDIMAGGDNEQAETLPGQQKSEE